MIVRNETVWGEERPAQEESRSSCIQHPHGKHSRERERFQTHNK